MRSAGGDGGESNSPSRTLCRRPLRACPMVCRRPPGRASAPCRSVQSRAPRSGLSSDYATLIRDASPLHDASTTRGEEMASTLTLLPLTRRGRESTGGCQVLRFAACLTRPDGTSARVPRRPSPVESTHPQDRTSVRRTDKCYHGPGTPPRPPSATGTDGWGRFEGLRCYGGCWPNLLTEDGGPKSTGANRDHVATAVPAAEPVSSPRRPRGRYRGARGRTNRLATAR